jgi:hypothetical protein
MSAATAAHAAAVANAIKASGVVVRVEAADFLNILKRADQALVVVSYGGIFKKQHKYLTSYKGLAFFTKSPSPLMLPSRIEIIAARSISIPDV